MLVVAVGCLHLHILCLSDFSSLPCTTLHFCRSLVIIGAWIFCLLRVPSGTSPMCLVFSPMVLWFVKMVQTKLKNSRTISHSPLPHTVIAANSCGILVMWYMFLQIWFIIAEVCGSFHRTVHKYVFSFHDFSGWILFRSVNVVCVCVSWAWSSVWVSIPAPPLTTCVTFCWLLRFSALQLPPLKI